MRHSCLALTGFLALVSALFVAPAAIRLNAAPTLVAAYNFNQGNGTTLTDVSGNNNHGALTNGPVWTTAGKYGGALTFDGANDFVSINDAASLDLTTGMTLEAWVKPGTLAGWRTVVLKEMPGNLAYGTYANQSAQRPGAEIRVGATTYNSSGTTALSTTAWTHLAATYDGSILRLYVNGTLAGSRSVSGSIATSSNPLRIGGNLIWGEYFGGQIDDVRIYNGALTQSQIQADMATPVAPAGPPDTLAPSVSMTAPANGDTVSGTVTLSAQASDNVGVSSVQFLRDGAAVGTADTSSPYAISWDTRSGTNGTHTFSARAVDAAGNSATSPVVTVTVNNPPRLMISQPANNSAVSGTTVNVVYTVTGDASEVAYAHFQLDGGPDLIDTTYDGAHQLSSVPPGAHVLTGFLSRADGSRITGSDASQVNFNTTVPDTTPPSVTLTSPVNGARVGGVIPVKADASDDIGVVGVRFTYDGTPIGAEDTASPYSVNWDTAAVSNGSHTLTAAARDAAAHSTTSSVTVIVSNETRVPLGTLNGHTAYGDGSSRIVSWLTPQNSAYDQAVATAWDFLLNRVPNDANGIKAYFTNSYLLSGTLAPSGWMHNPAHLNATIIESALAYYAYSGDARVVTLARSMADYHLAHGLTPANWSWAQVPYASGCGNCTEYDATGTNDSAGHIEPDKVGEFGLSLIRLYEFTGDVRYRDRAIASANALASHVRTGNATQSPWPFRVHAQTNVPREQYTANVIKPIGLFDELIRLNVGNVAAYSAARTTALNWLFAYPMRNNVWANYFEDVDVQSNLSNYNQYVPLETAYYLMRHPEHDPDWRTHVPALLGWVESVFGQAQFGATAINEQVVYRHVMGSHTSRYGGVNALYYELTGDPAARDKAYRALNWATYMISTSPQGQVIVGPTVDQVWFTDGYGDYIRHFMRGMGAVPEWAPDNQNHLTRSTSVVTAVNYSASEITYTTADPDAIDILKLSFTPVELTADGALLPRRTDLDAPGWVYDAATQVLKVRHAQATAMRISAQSTGPDTVAPVISSVASSGVTDVSATVSWTTNEWADSQVEYGVTTGYGSMTPLDASRVTSHAVVVSGLAPATAYYYRVRSSDPAGNLAVSGNATFTTKASDMAPPAVAVTAPAGGTMVTGTVTVTADASDDVGVFSVQFLLDGVNLGSADTTAPYSVSWNSTSTANGPHVLSARAVDAAGRATTSGAVNVTVNNPVQIVINFNDRTNTQAPLNGQYPAGVVDWGSNVWWLSGPWGQFTTNSISFSSSRTSGSFTFINPKKLISLRAFNGGSVSSTVTLSCSGNSTKTVSVGANQVLTISTGWTASCSTVTIGSSNGWDTNFDDLTYDGS